MSSVPTETPVLHQVTRGYRSFQIRPLFHAVPPGYFRVALEIPAELLDAKTPPEDFWLVIKEPRELEEFEKRALRVLTPEEALWTIGFMETRVANEVGEAGIRFVHVPFFSNDVSGARHLTVRQVGMGYVVETMLACMPARPPMRLAYALRLGEDLSDLD